MNNCCQLKGRHEVPLHSHSVTHWLRDTNSKIRGSEDKKFLKQHRDSLQAHHKGMVGSDVFISSLSVLSYVVASTKLLQQLLSEVGNHSAQSRSPHAQMLLSLKLHRARTLSHVANIESKLLGNVP